LLSDSSVQAIVVETSLADSPRAAQACLRAGKHIHLDKPGAASHAKFRALRLEAERRRLTVQMGYPKAIVTLRCNHGDPFGGPHRRFQVVGTQGAMQIQPLESGRGSLRLSQARGDFHNGDNPLALEVPPGRYHGEFEDLARVLRGGLPLAWSAEHDITVHSTALRCAGIEPD
jgi:predicted dehydrogenase